MEFGETVVPSDNLNLNDQHFVSVSFFRNGDSFGNMKWVGKAGIIGAMLLSMLIVRILGLFKRAPETEEVPTIAEKVLFYFVQGVGMLFLCMSSPNLELGLVAVVGGFNYETIEHLIWCMYLQANAVPANRV